MSVSIPPDFLQRVRAQAEKDYPNETCGILIGPIREAEKITALYPCRNVQDAYHAEAPDAFPRSARTAYFMDPRDLLRIQREAREQGCEMRVIYHSHVDAGAYFSEEDQRVALLEGKEPAYPGVSYLVVSVKQGKSQEMCLYSWNGMEGTFQPQPVG